jgi:hypothetical protein
MVIIFLKFWNFIDYYFIECIRTTVEAQHLYLVLSLFVIVHETFERGTFFYGAPSLIYQQTLR